MDFIKGLPLSDGHDTILVVVFCLTKMALFIPTFRDIDAGDLARIFLSQVFAKHGTLTKIISDWGRPSSLTFGGCSASCWASRPTSQLPTTPRPMVKPNGSTRSWNSIFRCTSTTNRTIGSTSFPWPSLHTTTLHTLQPWSPHSLLTRDFIPNSKCPSNLLCRILLTKLL